MRTITAIFMVLILNGASALASYFPESITYEVTVPTSIDEAWALWSTKEGMETFFAPYANIELIPGGNLDVWFFPENERGTRGAEGMIILAVEPNDRLVFTWDAPPHLPYARSQRSAIELVFNEVESGTRVQLTHSLFGRHDEWHQTRDYFSSAWIVILNRFAYRVHEGPLDWNDIPRDLNYVSAD